MKLVKIVFVGLCMVFVTAGCTTVKGTTTVDCWTDETGHHHLIADGSAVKATVKKDGTEYTIDTKRTNLIESLLQLLMLRGSGEAFDN
jgi:hypothetical protein